MVVDFIKKEKIDMCAQMLGLELDELI